jgi:hypothetical protein
MEPLDIIELKFTLYIFTSFITDELIFYYLYINSTTRDGVKLDSFQ